MRIGPAFAEAASRRQGIWISPAMRDREFDCGRMRVGSWR